MPINRRPRRSTFTPSDVPPARLRIRWDRIAGATAVGIAAAALIAAAWHVIPDDAPREDGARIILSTVSQHGTPTPTPDAVTEPADTEPAEPASGAEPAPAAPAEPASQHGTPTPDAVAPNVIEPAPLAGNGVMDDGEIADGPVTEYDEAILICGTEATVAIDTDIHGNAWAYCEPR